MTRKQAGGRQKCATIVFWRRTLAEGADKFFHQTSFSPLHLLEYSVLSTETLVTTAALAPLGPGTVRVRA